MNHNCYIRANTTSQVRKHPHCFTLVPLIFLRHAIFFFQKRLADWSKFLSYPTIVDTNKCGDKFNKKRLAQLEWLVIQLLDIDAQIQKLEIITLSTKCSY